MPLNRFTEPRPPSDYEMASLASVCRVNCRRKSWQMTTKKPTGWTRLARPRLEIPSRFGPFARGLVPGEVRDLLHYFHLHVVAEVVGARAVCIAFIAHAYFRLPPERDDRGVVQRAQKRLNHFLDRAGAKHHFRQARL